MQKPLVVTPSGGCQNPLSRYENHLLTELSPGYTIIIDKARFPKSAKTKELVEKAQCQLVFLPPYSPDLNPFEK